MSWAIKAGDARAVLAGEAAASVQTVATSPPYFGLRSYQTEGQIWGGAPGCDHVWGDEEWISRAAAGGERAYGSYDGKTGRGPAPVRPPHTSCLVLGCNAWRGELGGEPTVEAYVAHLVEVFRAVKRVLRPDGTLWVNLGDSFSSGSRTTRAPDAKNPIRAMNTRPQGTGEKQLLMVPARFALAMQADGWILRQAITWCKTAPMPESVQDRPTSATEMIYLFSQRPRYYFDAAAIAEPAVKGAAGSTFTEGKTGVNGAGRVSQLPRAEATTRNSWNYWLIGPAPSSLPHYAMFPPEIPRRAILAGTSAAGCCAACGSPYRRVVERTAMEIRHTDWGKQSGNRTAPSGTMTKPPTAVTTGWAPGCECGAGVMPCKVLDPFSGAGTTGQEALRLGRDFLGIELLPANVELSRRRIMADCPLFNTPGEIAV